jgi:cyclic-di-AMP phosphodiesterase PgpH
LTKNKIFYVLIVSFVISLLHFIITPYRFSTYEYEMSLGQIAEKDITAPFEFYIYKSEDVLKAEQETAAAKVKPVYQVSENLKFNAQKNLDFIFQFFLTYSDSTSDFIEKELQKNGYNLSFETIDYLHKGTETSTLYRNLSESINDILDIGIYPDNYSYQNIKLYRQNRIVEFKLSRLYALEEAKNKLLNDSYSEIMKNAIREISNIVFIENIVIDKDMTKVEKQKARENVPLTIGKELKNENILSKGQRVTTSEQLKLKSLIRAYEELAFSKNVNELLWSSLGVFILSFFMLFILGYVLQILFPSHYLSQPRLIILLLSILANILITILFSEILKIHPLFIPVSFTVIMISMLFEPKVGFLYNFINLFFTVLFLNWNFLDPSLLAISTIGGLIALKKIGKKQELYPINLYLLVSFLIVSTAVALIRFQSFTIYFLHLSYGFASCIISLLLLIGILPFVERKLNLATKRILLDLLDFENPLLKKMSIITPGTYHHALIVGNLAESAAEAVGADHLLARVGSYYHDIGKLDNPKFFIENNPEASEFHDNMLANESALLIKKHIEDGVKLAKKHKLPPLVRDIIEQHHGTSKIKFFYSKAQETNLQIDESHFFYNGPKPTSKEASIVMIADIVESTSKSLDDLNEDTIRKLIDDVISRLINEGQLDESPISMSDLQVIKNSMLPIIMGVYRKRLEYPEEK